MGGQGGWRLLQNCWATEGKIYKPPQKNESPTDRVTYRAEGRGNVRGSGRK
jgi:hypothetical protein